MIDLDAAEKLANAASGGTWRQRFEPAGKYGGGDEWHVDSDVVSVGCVTCGLSDATPQSEADAAFIAAARQLVPALIAEVRKLRDDLQHATAEDGDWLSKASRAMCNTVLNDRDRLREQVRRLSNIDAMAGRLKAIVGHMWSDAYCVEIATKLVKP